MTTVVNFVCDRLPDQDGCRFIELENDRGESVGADVGQWLDRDDGLVELRVKLSQPSGYTAVDMATAAADGFRDGAANMAEKAYLAGWNASGEGWNGEYPENASDRETWRKDRDADIESLLAPTSKEG